MTDKGASGIYANFSSKALADILQQIVTTCTKLSCLQGSGPVQKMPHCRQAIACLCIEKRTTTFGPLLNRRGKSIDPTVAFQREGCPLTKELLGPVPDHLTDLLASDPRISRLPPVPIRQLISGHREEMVFLLFLRRHPLLSLRRPLVQLLWLRLLCRLKAVYRMVANGSLTWLI